MHKAGLTAKRVINVKVKETKECRGKRPFIDTSVTE